VAELYAFGITHLRFASAAISFLTASHLSQLNQEQYLFTESDRMVSCGSAAISQNLYCKSSFRGQVRLEGFDSRYSVDTWILVGIIPTMKSGDIIKRLEGDGWYEVRCKGSHHQFKRLSGEPGLVTVPHPSKDIPTGTLRNIYRQAGWTWP